MSAETSSLPPVVARWKATPETGELLDFAELPILDLGEYSKNEGHSKLAKQLVESLLDYGSVYIVDHGYSVSQMDRIHDIADVPFSQLSMEEKQAYSTDVRKYLSGAMDGFRFRQYYEMEDGSYEEMETYNLHCVGYRAEHPEILRPFFPELDAFARHNHYDVAYPLLRLIETGLNLPDNTLVNIHDFSLGAESQVAFLKYFPRIGEEKQEAKHTWLSGETTKDTFSLIYSQSGMGFQIFQRGEWKYVKHVENAIILNVGDGLEIFSGGFFKATVHRVVRPPIDQRSTPRVGIFYFLVANNDVKMAPLVQSHHLLAHTGRWINFQSKFAPGFEPTVFQYKSGVGIVVQTSQVLVSEESGHMGAEEPTQVVSEVEVGKP
ncbi:hypothetical protein D9758_012794 [Tetrapyrgos nigripes]|uniref:Uncharacterized protein n=1 Tax=Tetrapyrgos nigripes TaxID=182062 RepID=A0A8H5FUK7_9AGAR|nr:hypothetical protein D9758_012794 [Tetrapyrgos nigripes]